MIINSKIPKELWYQRKTEDILVEGTASKSYNHSLLIWYQTFDIFFYYVFWKKTKIFQSNLRINSYFAGINRLFCISDFNDIFQNSSWNEFVLEKISKDIGTKTVRPFLFDFQNIIKDLQNHLYSAFMWIGLDYYI